jgi:hypothetical protein
MAMIALASACSRDVTQQTAPPQLPPVLTLVSQSTDSTGRETRTLSLVDAGPGIIVGSFRVAVHYDSARVRFAGTAGGDTLSVAVNDVGGRVLIAGASAHGFAGGDWLKLTFAPRFAGAPHAPLSLEVIELGDLHGGDLRPRVGVRPQFGVAK